MVRLLPWSVLQRGKTPATCVCRLWTRPVSERFQRAFRQAAPAATGRGDVAVRAELCARVLRTRRKPAGSAGSPVGSAGESRRAAPGLSDRPAAGRLPPVPTRRRSRSGLIRGPAAKRGRWRSRRGSEQYGDGWSVPAATCYRTPIMQDFSAQLARLKQACNAASDTALARILECSQGSISNAKAKRKLPTSWVFQISEKFSVSADWIYFGRGAMHPGETDARRVPAGAEDAESSERPVAVDSCPQCSRLVRALDEERLERRELCRENRRLWAENCRLREWTARLEERRTRRPERRRPPARALRLSPYETADSEKPPFSLRRRCEAKIDLAACRCRFSRFPLCALPSEKIQLFTVGGFVRAKSSRRGWRPRSPRTSRGFPETRPQSGDRTDCPSLRG